MKRRTRQKGFLAIVAVVIVTIIAFIVITANYQFIGDSLSSANHLRSAQAFYAAQSGILASKHNIINGTSCNGYSSGTVSLGQGQYSATGATDIVKTTLSAAITSTATTIPLTSTSGFTSSGVIGVDSEFITYGSISGNSLLGATRGASGTVAVAHSSGAAVVENECVITSVGGVPTIASPTGKRTLQMILPGVGFSLGTEGASASGFIIPAISATEEINISGGSINNPVVTSSSPGFANSTALTTANVVINSPGVTQVSSSTGTLTTSSSASSLKADVGQSTTLFTSANLWNKFFTQSQATVEAAANQTYTQTSINGATGQTIWFNGTLTIGNGVTIGSPTSPVILIMANSNLLMSGTATIYGFVYINPSFSISMTGTAAIIGSIAVNGTVNMNTPGTPSITLDPTILSILNITNSNTTVTYSGNPVSLVEVFS